MGVFKRKLDDGIEFHFSEALVQVNSDWKSLADDYYGWLEGQPDSELDSVSHRSAPSPSPPATPVLPRRSSRQAGGRPVKVAGTPVSAVPDTPPPKRRKTQPRSEPQSTNDLGPTSHLVAEKKRRAPAKQATDSQVSRAPSSLLHSFSIPHSFSNGIL